MNTCKFKKNSKNLHKLNNDNSNDILSGLSDNWKKFLIDYVSFLNSEVQSKLVIDYTIYL